MAELNKNSWIEKLAFTFSFFLSYKPMFTRFFPPFEWFTFLFIIFTLGGSCNSSITIFVAFFNLKWAGYSLIQFFIVDSNYCQLKVMWQTGLPSDELPTQRVFRFLRSILALLDPFCNLPTVKWEGKWDTHCPPWFCCIYLLSCGTCKQFVSQV